MCIWRADYMGASKEKRRNPVRPRKLVSPTLHETQEDAQEGVAGRICLERGSRGKPV